MSTNNITLSQACEGMIRYKQASGKSDHTISDYRVTFKKLFIHFPEDPPIASVTRAQMVEFFAWLQQDYMLPTRMALRRAERWGGSAKSVKNIHTNLSAPAAWGAG